MLNKPGKFFMQRMKVCLLCLNSYRCHTQLYARLWKCRSSYSKLLDLSVWIFCMWYQKLQASCLVVLGMKELSNLLQRYWVGRAGPIPWPGRSCEFTLLNNVFGDYVTEQIYIWPFGVLLVEGHNEIEHVLRPALLWDCTQHKVVIPLAMFWDDQLVPSSRVKMSKKNMSW